MNWGPKKLLLVLAAVAALLLGAKGFQVLRAILIKGLHVAKKLDARPNGTPEQGALRCANDEALSPADDTRQCGDRQSV